MKNLFIIILVFTIISCQKDPSNTDHMNKYFDPKYLPDLSIDNIIDFWNNDSPITYSNYFKTYSGYIDGIGLRTDKKSIGVAVFDSQEKAISCMEGRISTVAIVINPGSSNEIIKEKWWYTDGLNSCIFINKWNTIIEVSYNQTEYDEVVSLLIETAGEIDQRINNLGN